MADQTKKATGQPPAPEVDVQALHTQMLQMHAEAAQLLEDARTQAAAIVAGASGDGSTLQALVEALGSLQAPTVNVEVPKFELPPRADEKEEGFKPITFRSRDRSHLVVRVPRHRNTAPNGEVQTSEGRAYSFEPTGDLTVCNSDVAEFLRGRPGFNKFYVEVGKEPHSNAAMEPILEQITQARLDADDQVLEEIEALEAASLKRPLILNMVRNAREAVQKEGERALSEVLG